MQHWASNPLVDKFQLQNFLMDKTYYSEQLACQLKVCILINLNAHFIDQNLFLVLHSTRSQFKILFSLNFNQQLSVHMTTNDRQSTSTYFTTGLVKRYWDPCSLQMALSSWHLYSPSSISIKPVIKELDKTWCMSIALYANTSDSQAISDNCDKGT